MSICKTIPPVLTSRAPAGTQSFLLTRVQLVLSGLFVITRLSRAMRSLKHLLTLAGELRERGVGLVVLQQQIDTTTPQGRLVFHLLGAIHEFQRELIAEGTREAWPPPGPAAAPAAASPT